MSDLTRAAARWGVEPGYHDVSGRWHDASPLALRELTAALSAGRAAPSAVPPARDVVAWQCGERRMWGLAVQLYALRSARNWGHGDFGDLAALIETVAPLGCSAIGLNPLHALFPERAEDASPYSPSSRQFLNPLYIDLNAVDEFPGLAALGLEARVSELRAADMVQYAGVAHAKIAALRVCHARLRDASDARRRDFEDFQSEQGEDLVRFAAFEVLRQRFGGPAWWDWPQNRAGTGSGPARRRSPNCAPNRPTRSAFICTCNGSPKTSCGDASNWRAAGACRSGSISISRSASIRPAPTPGPGRARCSRACRSARRRTSTIPPARTGD